VQQSELIEIRNGPNLPKEIDTVKKNIRYINYSRTSLRGEWSHARDMCMN
jgi:hypothetical protein